MATALVRGEGRPLRADARRNRERVIAAAREVFAEHGHEAQVDLIARRAEVGVGTVYRHFPTKEALLEALVADTFRRVGEAAVKALDDPDPWEGFAGVLRYAGEILAGNRGLTEALAVQPTFEEVPSEHMLRLHESVRELIRRGQAAGVIRDDLQVDDIPMIMCGIGAATRKPHACTDSWRRHLAIALDGLRASAATERLPD